MSFELDLDCFVEQLRDMADELSTTKAQLDTYKETIRLLQAELARYEFAPKEAENLRNETAYAKQQLEAAREINVMQAQRVEQLELELSAYKRIGESEADDTDGK